MAGYADVQLALASGRGGAIVHETVDEVLAGLLRGSLPARIGPLPRGLAILHIIATFNTVLRWWLTHRRDMSIAEADALFRQLVLHGLPPEACQPFIAPADSKEIHA